MDTKTTLLIMSDGRNRYMKQMLTTIDKLHGNFSRILVHDDSGNKDHIDWLNTLGYEIATTNRIGFIGAMTSAWEKLKEDSNQWVFHLEEDFTIDEDIYISDMMDVMNNNTYLKQIVLQRQPIAGRELKMGGIINSRPYLYKENTDGKNYWVEHRVGFSCNPCLYRKSLIYENGWPNMEHSEREYGIILFSDRNSRCAYWGKKTDKPKVTHIGKVRNGFNY